jgi:hypothetical protein
VTHGRFDLERQTTREEQTWMRVPHGWWPLRVVGADWTVELCVSWEQIRTLIVSFCRVLSQYGDCGEWTFPRAFLF